MFRNRTMRVLAGALTCAVLCSGCGLFGGSKKGKEDDVLMPEPLEGDYALSQRPAEEMERVYGETFDNVLFAYDSFQLGDSEIPKIERVADYLRRNGGITLVVEGHCDERGSREYNLSLGEHRALAVRAYLIGLGIESHRIQTRSYGEERPLAHGHDESAWRQNRRGEFAFYR